MEQNPDQSFRPSDRLRKSHEIENVLKSGNKLRGKHLLLYGIANSHGHPRLGRVISKRWGNAVRRNRIRRWLREVFRRHKSAIHAMDLVVLLHNDNQLSYQKISDDFLQLVERMKNKINRIPAE